MSETREVGSALTYTSVFKGVLLFLLPLFIPALLLNVLYYSFQLSVELTLMFTIMVGSIGMAGAYGYYHKVGDELHGREVLVLTYREARGKAWTDFGVIWQKRPITLKKVRKKLMAFKDFLIQRSQQDKGELTKEKIEKYHEEYVNEKIEDTLSSLDLTENAPNPPPLQPYEYIFDGFGPFDRMILLQPCTEDELVEFTPQPIIYKGLFVNASAAPIDVTQVRDLGYIEGERIVVAIPTGADYYVEHIQANAKAFSVSKDEIDTMVGYYDAFRCIELKQQLVTKEAELRSALKALKEFDKAVERRKEAEQELWLEQFEHERRVPGFLKVKKLWLFLGLLGMLALLIYLTVI